MAVEGMKWGIKNHLNKKAEEQVSTFTSEHPVATCALAVMAAIIFAQHVELRCLRATHGAGVYIVSPMHI